MSSLLGQQTSELTFLHDPPYVLPKSAVIPKEQIQVPAHETRDMSFFSLPNGLGVFLVSDAECDQAAAALDVRVGALQDGELEGLAHFLEHMLFLGSSKYPDESEYKTFINNHSGDCNAYTSATNTNYHFRIAPEHFKGALDRFAQFFICPLFDQSCTKREVNAVHSEHSGNISNDPRRLFQLFKKTGVNKEHPYHQFQTGNLDTLLRKSESRNVDLRSELLDFHSRYYSSHLMKLCLVDRRPLAELRLLAETLFSQVPKKDVHVPRGAGLGLGKPFTFKHVFNRIVKVVPASESLRTVSFSFLGNSIPAAWVSKVDGYFAHIIGHEGPNSLLSALKKERLALGLSAGTSHDICGYSVFEIKVSVTEHGLASEGVKRIGDLIFQILRLVKHAPPSSERIKELATIQRISFQARTLPKGHRLASYVANTLQTVPPEFVFSHEQLLFTEDGDAVAARSALFAIDNLRICMTGSSLEAECRKQELFYGTRYMTERIPEAWVQSWSAVLNSPYIELPPPNKFTPQDVYLFPSDQPSAAPEEVLPTLLPVPSSRVTIFHKQDSYFKVPISSVQLSLGISNFDGTIKAMAMVQMLCLATSQALTETLYDASIAGYSFSFSRAPSTAGAAGRAVEVFARGYSEKLGLLICTMTSALTSPATFVDVASFGIARKLMLRYCERASSNQPPIEHCYTVLHQLMQANSIAPWSLESEVRSMSFADFQAFFAGGFNVTSVEGLLYGNLTRDVALGMATELVGSLKVRDDLPEAVASRLRVSGVNTSMMSIVPNRASPNSALFVFLPMVDPTMQQLVLSKIFQNWLSVPYFEQLRTKEQLGYVVSLTFTRVHEAFGPVFIILSEKSPPFLRNRILEFLDEQSEMFLTGEEFETHKSSVMAELARRYSRPEEESQVLFHEVCLRRYIFNKKEQQVRLGSSKVYRWLLLPA
ncbi:MAG: uncharacterized protein KVP18_002938 [Porospora cf. gigantea A]|uniref:uncharacterized protein n=1 Tax=Porospora cf. gigantea A TaxID=2853593 RepID=UPI00355A58DB|nr:MAG: hypothetical protein KVP18_002938 [Porospora cf. gigantea A]